MAQRALGREQTCVLVENAAHVLVGRYQTLHQHVGTAVDYGLHGQLHACHVALLVDDIEYRHVDAELGARLGYRRLVAVEGGLDKPLLICVVYRLYGVGILPVCHGQTFLASAAGGFNDFTQMSYHVYEVLMCFYNPLTRR